jgi:hypothetical protein
MGGPVFTGTIQSTSKSARSSSTPLTPPRLSLKTATSLSHPSHLLRRTPSLIPRVQKYHVSLFNMFALSMTVDLAGVVFCT